MTESGTCNVCSAPCTSCMHFNRLVTGVKAETFSGDAVSDKTSSQHSANKSTIVNPLKKHAFDKLQDAASATSSYTSLSENIKNETVRANISGEVSHKKAEKDGKESKISNLGGTKLELHELNYAKNDKGGPVVGSSDVSVKPGNNVGLKIKEDSNYISEESLDLVRDSKGTSDDPELTDVTEPSSESHSGGESEEVVEQDVNICDICGDAGREDLLATCSGCSDGAEHTYCMHEKMEKVPEGDWFCEECRLAEKSQKKCDMGDEIVKFPPTSSLRSLSRNLSLKLDIKESCVDVNSTELYTPGMQSRKRQLERAESSTGLKRQATETGKDLSVASSPHHFSRGESFKSGSREKVNKLYQPSHGMNNISFRPQTHKGPLSKSNSFNTVCLKSKERSVDDIPHKKKTHHEYTDPLNGASRHIARSMSLRPVHLGRPNAGEPKVIMLSPKSSHAPEMKGFKKKECLSSSMSRSLPSALDTNRKTITSEDGFESTDLNSRKLKATQLDEKLVQLTKLTAHATCSALDMPERKLNKPHGKEECTSRTWAATSHISTVDANIKNPELLPPQDASYQAVKNTDNNLTRTRLGKSVSGSNLCQRCKEPNTAAHVCISPRFSTSDPITVKIPVDDMEKINPVKAALHAAFLKKSVISKKRRTPDHEQFDDPITPNSGQNFPQDVWPGSSYSKSTSSVEHKHTQKLPLNNFSYATGQELRIDHLSHSSSLSKKRMIHADVGGDGKSIGNVLPNQYTGHVCTVSTTAIPVHEFIWQGDFEVIRNGEKLADMHPGFQAHLSTFSSPKVMEAVHKLTPRLSLTATPRLSAWPVQFHETGATEDNIAVYFFAKDIDSYERYYKVLLDNMMRNDLALKGDVNGVEILIFPSSQLPQKSQRWNMLFFMWGVFRAKKHNCHTQMASISRKLDASGKSCIVGSDLSPSIPVLSCPAVSTDSKQPDCELFGDMISGRSSSCAQSLSKRSPADLTEEEHVADMECEKANLGLNGGTDVTDMHGMRGNKCTPVLKNTVGSVQNQELHLACPKGVDYFNTYEKEVDRIMIEGKIKECNGDVKLSSKNEPSIEDVFANDFDCGRSNNRIPCHVDVSKISCRDSDIDIGKAQVASPGSKDGKLCCSTSETGPSNSSKKIMYDLNLDAVDTMEESGAAEGTTGWDLNSSANDIQVDCDSREMQDAGFDLASCANTESFPSKNGAPHPLFVGMGEYSEGGMEKKEETLAASLSLSLGLPFMDDKHESSKQSTQRKPPFPLFGGMSNK